jgi:hypothetical protein
VTSLIHQQHLCDAWRRLTRSLHGWAAQANLAAFLTRTAASEASVVKSMTQAVDQGLVICSHAAIRELLVSEYPEAYNDNLFRWYANTDAVLQGFKDRECELVTASIEAIELSPTRMSFCCAHNLASIGVVRPLALLCTALAREGPRAPTVQRASSLMRLPRAVMCGAPQLTNIPVAFPASPAVVNAISFWITQTQQPGTFLEQGSSEVQVRAHCSLLLPRRQVRWSSVMYTHPRRGA